MIPQRTLSGECEITTGAFSITKRPPVYTGESAALNVQVAFKFQGVDYTLPSGVVAEMYLRYPNTDLMTVAVEMEKSGNTASGVLSAEQTGVAGYPLLVIQLTDIETSALIVACATAVKVSDVRGDLVLDSRAPSPSEIIYIGRSPYINPTNGHWMQWDISTNAYVDTDVVARGLPATFTAYAETLPEGSDATASIEGTALNPVVKVGVPKGDKGNTGDTGPAAGFGTPTASVDSNVGTPSVDVTASGPATAKVFNFAFHNIKGQKGDTGDVASVNGQTGAVQLNDEHIPSTVDGKTNVEAVLSYHSQQIGNVELPTTAQTLTGAIAEEKQRLDNAFSAIAYVETGTTASRAYVRGDYVLVQNVLYIVATAIAESSAFTVNTNIIPVGEKGGLNALKFTKLGTLTGVGNNYTLTIPNVATELFVSLTVTADNLNAQQMFIIDWSKAEYYGVSYVGSDKTLIATLYRLGPTIKFIRCIYGSENPTVFTADIYWR